MHSGFEVALTQQYQAHSHCGTEVALERQHQAHSGFEMASERPFGAHSGFDSEQQFRACSSLEVASELSFRAQSSFEVASEHRVKVTVASKWSQTSHGGFKVAPVRKIAMFPRRQAATKLQDLHAQSEIIEKMCLQFLAQI